jgi:hypothetical protein
MKKLTVAVALVVLSVAATAVAQRVEDYRNANITILSTLYRSLPDAGTLIQGCGFAPTTDAGFVRTACTAEYAGRTVGQRNALSQCLGFGEQVWALDQNIRTDAGF